MRRFSVILAVLIATGCVVESNERCGSNQTVQRFGNSEVCICDDGFFVGDDECIPNEFTAQPCTTNAECTEDGFPLCIAGECSRECSSLADCPISTACFDDGSRSYCRRPRALGLACGTDQLGNDPAMDCVDAGADPGVVVDATLCSIDGSGGGVCVVDCTDGAEVCSRGEFCCDLSSFGLSALCLPDGTLAPCG